MSFDKVDNHSNQDKNTFITIKNSLCSQISSYNPNPW